MATGLLEALGLPKSGAPPKNAAATPPPVAQGMPPPPDGEYSAPLADDKSFLDLNSPRMRATLMKGIQEQAEKDRKDAEAALVKMNKALADAKAYVAAIPDDQLRRSSYAQVMADVRKRFPEAAGLSQWVKETSVKVPELKGKLPSPKALMVIVESTVKSRGAELGWSLSTGKDLRTVNTDRLLAAYM